MSEPGKIRIAIIGGGIVGIALATGLLKYEHLDVHIFEAASNFSEIGAGLTIAPNARQALEQLGPRLTNAYEGQRTPNLWSGNEYVYMIHRVGYGEREGEVICAPKSPGGHQSVHRAKFLEEVAEGIPPDRALFNKRLIAIEEHDDDDPITLRFEDGTTEVTDAVLGADGIHSFVRGYLLGENHPAAKPVFTGTVAYRQIVPMDLAVEKLGVEHAENATIWCGPGGAMFTYPLEGGESINMVSMDYTRKSWDHEDWKVEATREELENHFKGWGPISQSMIDVLTARPLMVWGVHDHAPAPYYNKGRVVMLGDAAHASTPYQGQGAGQGIEDAATLDALLARTRTVEQLSHAFASYDQVRRPRSQRVVATSREAGHLLGMQLEGVGADIDKMRKRLQTRFYWLWNRNIEAQNRAAVELFEESFPLELKN